MPEDGMALLPPVVIHLSRRLHEPRKLPSADRVHGFEASLAADMKPSISGVARTVPTSENRAQLRGMKRPGVRTVRIASVSAKTTRAIKESGARKAMARLADDERRNERAARRRILLHQALQGFCRLMDGMGRQNLKRARQLPVSYEGMSFGDVFEKYPRLGMDRYATRLCERFSTRYAGHASRPLIGVKVGALLTDRTTLSSR